ncbi:hypothetical protein GCM10007275_18530 [Jeotgalicoccus coquinae]|uniref:CHASE2 domain-containing sensor protein n=1 Tax=Jeotgalicoccus coquinae TaxID=709509 RepID=A0A6V7RQY1_9STAP|nr:hypothetical protein [Jeotgalicoccus coquinae]MBB6423947.1 CHASE2 domain-containing sensor protein [Jeotgalicoccus coquinae]GGE23735.1 hypothetical protein GCM10007275_18530 [Jeotgalicoccus coquinae]CAD2080337.1 hypothetical protein JEOCOQ751_01719 [Jeotgalicoccus coquinae]
MITIGAVLLIVLIYAIVNSVKFFKDTELSKAVKEKMLAKAFKAAFITVIAGWGFFELFMIMRIDPSFEIYRLVILIIVVISFIVFGLNLKVQNQRPE